MALVCIKGGSVMYYLWHNHKGGIKTFLFFEEEFSLNLGRECPGTPRPSHSYNI